MALDTTQVIPKRHLEDDTTPPPVLVRLHDPNTGVQILVTEHKAARLITEGTYHEGALPTPKQQGK